MHVQNKSEASIQTSLLSPSPPGLLLPFPVWEVPALAGRAQTGSDAGLLTAGSRRGCSNRTAGRKGTI